MDQKAIIKFCKALGCCDACCLRYTGVKSSSAYENPQEYVQKQLQDSSTRIGTPPPSDIPISTSIGPNLTSNGCSPPAKKKKIEVCVSCLGLLQSETWSQSVEMVKEMLDKKCYKSETFAIALSAPITTIFRENYITMKIEKEFPDNKLMVTAIKEAWRWSFGVYLSRSINWTLDSGAVSPLLITLNMEQPDEAQELAVLEQKYNLKSRKPYTRRDMESAAATAVKKEIENADDVTHKWDLSAAAHAQCVSVGGNMAPVYLAGRYIKTSRVLPQTPWLVNGVRMMHSSVQETIFQCIAPRCGVSIEEMDHRMKFLSAGREDVDVRCLGKGRPFAIEITDTRSRLTEQELKEICDEISASEKVIVKKLVYVTREDLVELKKGEETKWKEYEVLVMKLTHGDEDDKSGPVRVTSSDVSRLNAFWRSRTLEQRTPLRVLHRRPLLRRHRALHAATATALPEHESLLVVRCRTEAGAYVKEWVCGDAGRTAPALGAPLAARLDCLALDVTAVALRWPPGGDDADDNFD